MLTYIFYNNYPIINVKFNLQSQVNQTSTEENSVLTVFIIVKTCGEMFNNCPNCLFGTKLYNAFDAC